MVGHAPSQGIWGSSWCPVTGPSVAVVGCACSQESRSSGWLPVTGPLAVVCTCLWSPRWQWRLVPTPAAHVRGALPPESVCGERSSYGGPTPLLAWPPTIAPSLSGGPRPPLTPHSTPLRLSPCSQPQSSPPGLTTKAQASAHSPHLPQRWVSQAGECWVGGTDHVCRSLCTLPSVNRLLCSPLRLQSSPSVPADLLASKGTSQCVENFTLSQILHRSTGSVLIPFSLSLFFFFFFSLFSFALSRDFLAFLEVWGLLPEFSRCSMRIAPHVDVFLM